ncbi:MAG: HIT family protein [Burkholderiales bacterium]|nr:HIT family protein [Burkholderiales bacterium]
MASSCLFCDRARQRILCENALAYATPDSYPVNKGHTLIIPRRHVASFFDTTPQERLALFALLDEAKGLLDAAHGPDGYNIGVNGGLAAGQSIMHLHVHLIPRYTGDREDPKGGVRWIFPERAAYWERE